MGRGRAFSTAYCAGRARLRACLTVPRKARLVCCIEAAWMPGACPSSLRACLCKPAAAVPQTLGEVALISATKILCTVICVAALVVLAVALLIQGTRLGGCVAVWSCWAACCAI